MKRHSCDAIRYWYVGAAGSDHDSEKGTSNMWDYLTLSFLFDWCVAHMGLITLNAIFITFFFCRYVAHMGQITLASLDSTHTVPS